MQWFCHMPLSVPKKMTEQEFRQQVLQKFTEHKCLDFMFDQVKAQACKNHDVNGEAL